MRKIYLLITAALLLIGSSGAFAEVIAKVGDTEFDTDDYEGKTSKTLVAALENSLEDLKAELVKDITLESGITVAYGKKYFLNLKEHTITKSGWSFDVYGMLDIEGPGTIYSTRTTGSPVIIYLNGTSNPNEPYNSKLNIGEKVLLKCQVGYGIAVYQNSDNCAFGAEVNFNGDIQTNTGITILGNIQKTSGNIPVVNIKDGATLNCGEACVYAAGYGVWNIGNTTHSEDYTPVSLTAQTAIYAKSGVININNASLNAIGEFSEPIEYGNGFYSTGDAIILDTHKSYAGNMLLNIIGDDTEIKAAHGYAIHEAMTKAAAEDASSAIGLTIQGIALIEGGDAVGAGNATKFTERFTQALKDGSDSQYQWVVNGVSGGRYTSEPSVVAPGYEAKLNTETGFWEVKPQSTPAPAKLYTIIENTEWPATDLADNSEVLIKTGATLTVPSISVEDGSVITVEPGAKLVAGENGIITASPSGLILKADEANGTGVVLFDGTVSNKQPQGTVELYLVAKKIDDSNYVWQHFGIPTTSAPTITRIEPVSYKDWDVKQGWIYTSGSAALTAPWVGHNVTTSAIAEGNIISFAGTLVGMTDATLNLSKQGYNCLSNSFTAPISVKSFVSGIGTSLTTDGMVWIYDPETDNFTKKNKASFILDPTDVFMPSMQGFFLLNSGASPIEVSLPYSNVETTAGLKDAAAYNGGIISLSNGVATSTLQILEGDEFSDEFENSYDGYQMPTDNIQIYAIQGADKLASIATNNIDGKEIEIVTTAGTEYSLSFSNLLGNAFKLKDLLTGDEIEVSEDNVYRFTAEPNSTLRRFKISEGEVSADEADADAVKVWVAESSLNIAGAVEGDAIEVINLAGVKVLSATATGEAVQAISLNGIASGAYIVKAGAATVKVIK